MSKVSVLIEIPEDLHEGVQNFLEQNIEWDVDRVHQNAIAQFLMHNAQPQKPNCMTFARRYRRYCRLWLDSMFTGNARN